MKTQELPTIDYRKVKPLQGNLKDLSKPNFEKLKKVLEKRGFDIPMFLWKKGDDYYIIDAHQRVRVAKQIDLKPYEVPYVEIEAKDEAEAKKRVLEISSQYGTITQEGYDEFTADLPEAELIETVNFDALKWDNQEEVEEDEAPEVSDEPAKSKLGEIYQLGRHRLMCGDATKDVDTLMDGAKADMVFTDPPYGMDYSGRGKETNSKIMNDDADPTEFYGLGRDISERYFWGRVENYKHLPEEPRDTIIWKKNNFGMGSGYRGQYECCFYYGDFNGSDSDVWEVSKDSSYEHPTQKPVALCARAIKNSDPSVVIDYFMGSGSTLIACEQLDRTCYGMELDPKYVDVIRKRYHKLVADSEEGWEEGTPVISGKTEAVHG